MASQQALRGFKDQYPAQKAQQQYIFSKVREVAKQLGYEEYDGPIVEPVSLYADKSSEELLEKQTFQIKPRDKDDQWILRPEMTPTLARMVAAKSNELIFPLRYFNIGPRFRYEAPQKGRSREFCQMDFDLLGSTSVLSDAEVLLAVVNILKSLGATEKDFTVFLNSRSFMKRELDEIGINEYALTETLQKIDRMDKGEQSISPEVKKSIETEVVISDDEYFSSLFAVLKSYGIDQFFKVDLKTVRGLDYYTGLVFEVRDKGELRRAILGGGRYDNLISKFNKTAQITGVGFAVSDIVLQEFLEEKKLLPELSTKSTKVLVTVFDQKTLGASIEITSVLRKANVFVELYPETEKKLEKQLKYADRNNIPYVLIIGPEEVEKNIYKLKDMKTKEQTTVSKDDLLKKLT